MGVIDKVHGGYIHRRRVRVLADHLVSLIPPRAQVLDVGCGDGLLDKLVLQRRPDIAIEGIDVLVRGDTHIKVNPFDGQKIPHPDKSFDAVTFVDVLHHTVDPMILLREAARVSRNVVIIKDHTQNGLFAHSTLRFMDRVGNARYGVALPYNYWPRRRWQEAIAQLRLSVVDWRGRVGLYPFPLNMAFGRSLHFVASLGVAGSATESSAVAG